MEHLIKNGWLGVSLLKETSKYIWLVVLTILKILVNGKDYPIYEMEHKKIMFETTNQI